MKRREVVDSHDRPEKNMAYEKRQKMDIFGIYTKLSQLELYTEKFKHI